MLLRVDSPILAMAPNVEREFKQCYYNNGIREIDTSRRRYYAGKTGHNN
jgi:hypothetical protein